MIPLKVYLFSGKRKCGKDYFTDKLYGRLNEEDVAIIKISGPIKHHWANLKGLDYQKLIGSGSYKENFRKEMITWSEKVRNDDYGIFCRAAVELYNAMEKPIWIVSDIRRKTDIRWFRENFGDVVTTVKITADNEVRKKRGWIFEKGIDDQETECDLDDVTDWDLIIMNNGSDNLEVMVDKIKYEIDTCLKKS